MLGYRVPAPDEAMLIFGGRRGQEGAPFRVVTGHGAFVMPFIQKARFLTLAMQTAGIAEQCLTRQDIMLLVRAVAEFRVGHDRESITRAGRRFLSDQQQMQALTGRIFAGHLRWVIRSMTIEEIIARRQELTVEVVSRSTPEMARLGLSIDSLQVQSIDDMGAGYIKAMAAPHLEAIRRQARIAQEAADQRAAQERQDRERPP